MGEAGIMMDMQRPGHGYENEKHTRDSDVSCAACGDPEGCSFRKVKSVYVASSWRNDIQPLVVSDLRDLGLEVYDFKDTEGFQWADIDDSWKKWTPRKFIQASQHDLARRGFERDLAAMQQCDACVMVQPCGVSAALELGWFAGAGKPTAVLLRGGHRFEPELMLKLAGTMCGTLSEVWRWLSEQPVRRFNQL